MPAENILTKAQNYVANLFHEKNNEDLVFHNYARSKEIADSCSEIADEEQIPEAEKEKLLLAAWFLLTGYTKDYNDPLTQSVAICRNFLKENNCDQGVIEDIEKLIMATTGEDEPQSAIGKILHDAQCAFIGKKSFFSKAEMWRIEKEKIEGKEYPTDSWALNMRDLLVSTNFYTPYAIKEFEQRRKKNILKQAGNYKKEQKIARRIKTGKDFGRGIDTLYRNTLRGHLDLSSIADGKANMMISINALILSILITAGSATISVSRLKLEENLQFVIPTLILMTSSLGAIIFAVFSAIPKYSSEDFELKDVKKNKISLLFFNNFLNIKKEEFVEYLDGLKHDQDLLYNDLARDVYNLGAVLKKKYWLLNIAYKLFVAGLAMAFLAFVILLSIYGV